LYTQFPEGSRVDDTANGKIHIWGKGWPIETFNSTESLMKYLYARAREYQRKSGVPLVPRQIGGGMTLLIVNGVLCAALAILMIVRRRITRGEAGPSKS
jgi:hypothetical protein